MTQMTLEAARVNVGLSRKDAAKKLGISEKTLYRYEHGYSYPDIPILQKIERLYNVTYNDLIFLKPNYV